MIEQNFPQIPCELYKSPIANMLMEEFVLKRETNMVDMSKQDMTDLYFVLGIDYWIGNKKDYIIINLTGENQ